MMNLLRAPLVSIAIVACNTVAYPDIAFAQELVPLAEAISAGAEETYPLVRCAALNFAILDYAGTDRFEPNFVKQAADSMAGLMAGAVTIRVQSNGGSGEITQTAVQNEMLAISSLYVERFNKNYSAVGQAFVQDPLVNADLEFCKLLVETVNEH